MCGLAEAPFGLVLQMRRVKVVLAFLLLVASAVGVIRYEYARTREAGAKQQEASAVPIKTAVAEARDVSIILRGLGRVEAFNSVAIKSRVEGHITKINFREGQTVHAGDLLIQIDPRPSQAALDQARAVLAKDRAALANAQTDLQRYGKLLTRNITPEQQYTTQKSTVAQDDATLQNDQAQVEAAELNVGYASITSPIDGVTGIRQVDLGNLVQVNSNNAATLATVTQIKPIYVVFTLPEVNIQRILEAMRRGPLRVEAFDQADQKETAAGVLNLVDNAVDPTTGMVKLKAQFANEDDALWPGQFVNAHLVLEVIHNGVNVPAAAVQTGPNGNFTYVVKANSTVDMRPITVTQTENNMALIGSGLKAGEEVVTAGQFKLRPGAKVLVSDKPAQSTTAGALGLSASSSARQ